ncbi:serine/threonine-protein kinase [Streptacidiphilus sp. PAMC 29251]
MSNGNGDGSGRLVAGRYRLLSRLGRGGMGTVWRAEDELLNRQVAVKEVHLRGDRSAEEGEQQRNRTLREARAVAQVRHPSVVGIHDVVEQDGEPWIVMELIDGTTLGARLAAEGPLQPEEAASIGLAVLSALEAAHSRGVLHRDVKPDNVLLERETGRVVLTDFGIARLDGSVTLTEAGAFLGSPEFTAPERTAGGEAGPESDLWSVGVLLCAALEGRSPFRRDSMSGVLYAVLYEDIVLPASAEPLADVVRGLLQRDPARRMTAVQASWLLTDHLERGSLGVSPTADTLRAAPRTLLTAAEGAPAQVGGGPAGAGDGPAGAGVPAGVPVQAPSRATVQAPPQVPESSPESSPVREPEHGGGRWRPLLLGVAVVVVAGVLAAGGVLLVRHNTGAEVHAAGGPTSSTASAPPSTPASDSASASASASVTASPTTATPTSSASPITVAVPAGYTFRHDPKGFSLAVPDGWGRSIGAGGGSSTSPPTRSTGSASTRPRACRRTACWRPCRARTPPAPRTIPASRRTWSSRPRSTTPMTPPSCSGPGTATPPTPGVSARCRT